MSFEIAYTCLVGCGLTLLIGTCFAVLYCQLERIEKLLQNTCIFKQNREQEEAEDYADRN